MKAVSIIWYDSYSLDDSWHKKEVAEKMSAEPFLCYTAGYLFKKNKYQIVICHTYNDEQVCGVMIIPRKCIKKMHYL